MGTHVRSLPSTCGHADMRVVQGKRAASQKRAEEEAWRDKLSAELDHDSFRQRDRFAEVRWASARRGCVASSVDRVWSHRHQAWWRDEEADVRGKTAAETADAFFDRIAREASAKRRQRASSPGVGGGSFVHGAPRRSQHHGSTNGGDTARGTLPSSSQRPRVFGACCSTLRVKLVRLTVDACIGCSLLLQLQAQRVKTTVQLAAAAAVGTCRLVLPLVTCTVAVLIHA